MDSRNVVNIICLIVGVGCLVCGIMIRAGVIPQTVPARGIVSIVLGLIIIAWNGYALMKRRRK